MNLDTGRQEAEAVAARSNMTNVVGMLHDKSSQFMGLLMKALEAGKICVVDVSQMRGTQSFILAGIILRRIFDRNQEEFTKAVPRTVPVIAVIEEAQAVLNERASAAEPYISWVKEGRKYDLGALLITQQPGSIPNEILSQGDNWFIFHLLSAGDLASVKRANAHFSDDLLSSLLNEPIAGQGVFWSSVGGKPYPVSIRALSFEDTYNAADPTYSREALPTFATELRREMTDLIDQARASMDQARGTPQSKTIEQPSSNFLGEHADDEPPDLEVYYQQLSRRAVEQDADLTGKLRGDGAAWGHVRSVIAAALPATLDGRDQKAFQLVIPTMSAIFGAKGQGWHAFKRGPKQSAYIKLGPSV